MRIISLLVFLLFFLQGFALQVKLTQPKSESRPDLEADMSFIRNHHDIPTIEHFLYEVFRKDSKKAYSYYNTYLERGIRENNRDIQFTAHHYIGYIAAYYNHNYNLAIQHGKSAIEVSKGQKASANELYVLHTLIGAAYFNTWDYETALHHYLEANEIRKTNDISVNVPAIITNLAMVRTRIHRYQDALASYLEVLALLESKEYQGKSAYQDTLLAALLGAGVSHFEMKNPDSALAYYQKGLALAKAYDNKRKSTLFNMTIGEAYTEKGIFDKALEHLTTAENAILGSETFSNSLLLTNNFHFANYYFKNELYSKALDKLTKNFEIVSAEGNEKHVKKIDQMYELARKCAEKLGDTEKELLYAKAYMGISNSLHQNDIETKDKLYDADIESLKEKNELLSSKNTWYISGILLTVSLFSLLFFLQLKKQQKNKALFQELQNEKSLALAAPVNIRKDFVTDRKAKGLLEKLKDFEATHFYLDQECNLYTTAKKIGTNTTYLSKIMNGYGHQSFSDYIHGLRIQHCRERLKTDAKFRSYTIKAIAGELGYKSVNTFAAAFKKKTGLSHSFYLKQATKNEEAMVQYDPDT